MLQPIALIIAHWKKVDDTYRQKVSTPRAIALCSIAMQNCNVSTNCINYCPLEKSRRYIPAKSIYNSCHCVPLKCNIACPEMQLLSFLLWRKVGRCIKSPLTRERKSFKFNALVSTSLTKVAYLWQCWELWSMGGIK